MSSEKIVEDLRERYERLQKQMRGSAAQQCYAAPLLRQIERISRLEAENQRLRGEPTYGAALNALMEEESKESLAVLYLGIVTREKRLREMSSAMGLVGAERDRQVQEEGWTVEHDDGHTGNQLAMAAACYASPVPLKAQVEVPCGCRSAGECSHVFGKKEWIDAWPWDPEWDKRHKHSRLRQLAIAGALIIAEMERLERAILGFKNENVEAR